MLFCPQEADWGNVADWAGVAITFFLGIVAARLTSAANRIANETHEANRSKQANELQQLEYDLFKLSAEVETNSNRVVIWVRKDKSGVRLSEFRRDLFRDLATFKEERLTALSPRLPILSADALRAVQSMETQLSYLLPAIRDAYTGTDLSEARLDYIEGMCARVHNAAREVQRSIGYVVFGDDH